MIIQRQNSAYRVTQIQFKPSTEMRTDMDVIEERYGLAKERIRSLPQEEFGKYNDYVNRMVELFEQIETVYEWESDSKPGAQWNQKLYEDLVGENYLHSYGNPKYAAEQFGVKCGQFLSWYYARCRDAIVAAYDGDQEEIVLRMELFLQAVESLSESEDVVRSLKETMYYFIHDYEEIRIEKNIRRMLVPDEHSRIHQIVMNGDFSDTSYLYDYGEYITENEKKMAEFLASQKEETLAQMARTYTEGYKEGFRIAGIDLTKKSVVQIRYHVGFEPMVRQAVLQFEQMGLKPVFTSRTNTASIGVVSTPANKQYQYDHRYDEALVLNQALIKERLKITERIYEKYKTEAAGFAGPAVIEIFGEKLFSPETQKESPAYDSEQERLSVAYTRDAALIQNRYIPQDQRSFTIIAYPVPDIGPDFEKIFEQTVRVNTLDMNQYREIQQHLIDALDQGDFVRVTGRGENHTDITIKLYELEDPKTQTNFENCLADVNIPVGEVFTSPMLTGTNGVLHVKQVYLNHLQYKDLEFHIKDGMVTDYNCANYKTEEENRTYIKQNIMYNRPTLPVGEFAIGTNTTAYVMGRKYQIEAQLPILIAEKTGPHFALGDTCYSMSEDIILHNPDGKEIIAKENECSQLRHTQIEKAYFQCHTDITIPYDELGDIVVYTKNGITIPLIQEGRFVLEGTKELNEVLEELA